MCHAIVYKHYACVRVSQMVPMVYHYRSKFYQWSTVCTNDNANGTIGFPNGTIDANGKPMVPLVSQWYHLLPTVQMVKLPMILLGEPRTEPITACLCVL